MRCVIGLVLLLLVGGVLVSCGLFPCFDDECYDDGSVPKPPDETSPPSPPPPKPGSYQVSGYLTAGSGGMTSWTYVVRGELTNFVSSPQGYPPQSATYTVVTGNL